MANVPKPMRFILLFIFTSMFVMLIDGLYFDNYMDRPAMSMMHMEMKPTLYPEPAAPNLEQYWARYLQFPSSFSDPNEYEDYTIEFDEDGKQWKVYTFIMQNVLHEIRPTVKVPMFSFNGKIPGPSIRVNQHDNVRVRLYNNGTEPHTIHWHGINNVTEWQSDGVPSVGAAYEDMGPGSWFEYNMTMSEAGTRMYHCHVEAGHHMAMGMFGAIIIDPVDEPEGNPFVEKDEEGHPLTSETPDVDMTWIFSEMETKHAHVSVPNDMGSGGPDGALPWLIPSRKFNMPYIDPEMDEFMINGKAFPANAKDWIHVKPGDIVRLRMINLGHKSHSIHIHGHTWIVASRDGHVLDAPWKGDTQLIGAGERYDVWFRADNPGIWPVHDHQGAETAKGYEPAGILSLIIYEGQDMTHVNALLKRIEVYTDFIQHADDDHGKLTPDGMVGMMMEMEGMDMGDGGH